MLKNLYTITGQVRLWVLIKYGQPSKRMPLIPDPADKPYRASLLLLGLFWISIGLLESIVKWDVFKNDALGLLDELPDQERASDQRNIPARWLANSLMVCSLSKGSGLTSKTRRSR